MHNPRSNLAKYPRPLLDRHQLPLALRQPDLFELLYSINLALRLDETLPRAASLARYNYGIQQNCTLCRSFDPQSFDPQSIGTLLGFFPTDRSLDADLQQRFIGPQIHRIFVEGWSSKSPPGDLVFPNQCVLLARFNPTRNSILT